MNTSRHLATVADSGTPGAQHRETVAAHEPNDHALLRQSRAFVVAQPRLVSIDVAASVLGIGADLVRGLIESGELKPVRVPRPQTLREHKRGARSAEVRRTLLDVRDLDALVERWKADAV